MRRFDVQFSEQNLTGNAGLLHLGRFAEKLGPDKLLLQLISLQRSENATYSPADAILMLSMSAPACADLMDHLEEKSSQYMIKMKMRGLESLLENQKWRKLKSRRGFESAKFH